MFLSLTKLYNYKNYASAHVDWHEKVNIITGLNGMGKTNMLDAIYYTCLGKSFFNNSDRLNVLQGGEGFRIESHFHLEQHQDILEIKVYPGKSKEIVRSGDKVDKITDHVGTFPCVIVTPIDIQLMLDGSEERRKFLDNTICQCDSLYLSHLLKYNRLLKQRNALLKSFIENRSFNKVLLSSIDEQMYVPAAYVFAERQKKIEQLSLLFEKYYAIISGQNEHCSIAYKSLLLEQNLESIFEQNMQKDRIMGRTTGGIHRDDMTFKMNDNKLKDFASQGQLKSFVLALKLAQYELLGDMKNKKPLLLLDDIFDKLDRNRVAYLLDIVCSKDLGQVFITDTNDERVADILLEKKNPFALYNVDKGIISKKNV